MWVGARFDGVDRCGVGVVEELRVFTAASGACRMACLLLCGEVANANSVDLEEGELELVVGVAMPGLVGVVLLTAVWEFVGGGDRCFTGGRELAVKILEGKEGTGDLEVGMLVEDGSPSDAAGTHVITDDRNGVDVWEVVENFAVRCFGSVYVDIGFA